MEFTALTQFRFNDDEITSILKLVVSKPQPTPAGIQFVMLGLCIFIVCPSLMSHPKNEAICVQWVQWLIAERQFYKSNCNVSASFGRMLLLMAIHFRENRMTAIRKLVCSTLNMEIPQRRDSMMKHVMQIFTHNIFTEQVMTEHAINVQVTPNLNANDSGYLPVHCIQRLLKSRAFSMHKVPIESWTKSNVATSCRNDQSTRTLFWSFLYTSPMMNFIQIRRRGYAQATSERSNLINFY